MSRLLPWIGHTVRRLVDLLWTAFALLLDLLGGLDGLATGLLVTAIAAAAIFAAHLMQRLLVRQLSRNPERRVAFRSLEKWFFVPAWPLLPILLVSRALRGAWRTLTGLRRKGKQAERPADREGREAPFPFLAATLGPSFLLASLLVVALHLLARMTEPLLRVRLGLATGTPAWEHLLLGDRPELALWLPLGRTAPFLAALVLFVSWTLAWWWLARLVRLVHWRHLGANLVLDRDRADVLPTWRGWAAVRHLVRPSRPYRAWAGTLVVSGLPLAIWGWFGLGDVPYRVGPGDLAVALVALLGWSVHLMLSGAERRPVEPEATPEAVETIQAGWPEVRDDLVERLQVEVPPTIRSPRPVPTIGWADDGPESDPLLSPLLAELVPLRAGRRRLTSLQQRELQRLSRLGHVFTRPVLDRGELSLGRVAEEHQEVRERNRILLAPEGSGKTTLAILAAANHALVHTRATLLVVRDERAEEALYERIQSLIDPSTLRWTVRLRRLGRDLANDFSRAIVPDVVVTSLENLTTEVLQQVDTYAPLLHRLGLVVVDDVESFAGNVETHAQLAFRRLTLAARKLLGVEELGEVGRDLAPLVLVLGTDSMHRTATWIESLLGIDAELERAQHAFVAPSASLEGQRQEVFRLQDFQAATGERLTPVDVVETCERLAVPWHFRRCADGQRHLGRGLLLPQDEPVCFATDPRQAAVVLLEGAWSEVRRELDRLELAGVQYPRRPCAVLTLVDPDEDMAFTQHDRRLSLAGELDSLPRPVLRPPSGRTVASHLASDLTQSWTEVEDVLNTFGNAAAHKLRELARDNLLLTERRVDVHQQRDDYVEKVFVRALSSARASEEAANTQTPLPAGVTQVELATGSSVQVLDRTDLTPLLRVDADSAGLAYYPGRIFTHQGRRYVVVHHAAAEGGDERWREERQLPSKAILVEPMLGDDVSSPRRRVRLEAILGTGDAGRRIPARLEGGSGAPNLVCGEVDPSVTGHAFYGPVPVRIGEGRIQVELALVRLRARHHSTYLLGPTFCEIRQRRLLGTEGASATSGWDTSLTTVALCLYPNPDGENRPMLTLRGARLVAAALRAVLASMYRGAREGLGIALHIEEDDPTADHVLRAWEGFVLFDLHSLGNGTARAIHRDGIELLLRLARLYLERVLYHDRLLALHDHWSNGTGEWDLYGLPSNDDRTPTEKQNVRRKAEAETREAVLRWLDSRLRPEGDAAAFSGALGRHPETHEPGEGDLIDIGRCWYSARGSVADLVWSKHRWRLTGGDEAMLDVGFDRRLADGARDMTDDDPALEAGRQLHHRALADPKRAVFGAPLGAPHEVWRVEGEERKPHSSKPGQGEEALAAFHARQAARAVWDWPHLGPLARKLYEQRTGRSREVFSSAPVDTETRLGLSRYLAHFVQGIPTLRTLPDGSPPALRSALRTLLERRGSVHDKSLLLALLLNACGIPAGTLLSISEGRSLVAAALPDPVEAAALTSVHFRDEQGRFAREEDSTGRAEHFARSETAAKAMYRALKAWSAEVGLSEVPPCWSVLPVSQAGGDESEPTDPAHALLYVPIETATTQMPGVVRLGKPDSWIFLPLESVLHHLPSPVLEAEIPSADGDGGRSATRGGGLHSLDHDLRSPADDEEHLQP